MIKVFVLRATNRTNNATGIINIQSVLKDDPKEFSVKISRDVFLEKREYRTLCFFSRAKAVSTKRIVDDLGRKLKPTADFDCVVEPIMITIEQAQMLAEK